MNSVCTGVEMFHKLLDQGMAGDNLGLLLRGINRDDVERGMVIAKPGVITSYSIHYTKLYETTLVVLTLVAACGGGAAPAPAPAEEEAAARTQARIDTGQQTIVGVNKFQLDEDEDVPVLKRNNFV